jgi:hypothetical protein
VSVDAWQHNTNPDAGPRKCVDMVVTPPGAQPTQYWQVHTLNAPRHLRAPAAADAIGSLVDGCCLACQREAWG